MKKSFFVILALSTLILTNCSSKKNLVGNWETIALINQGKNQPVLVSNIKFDFVNNEIKAKGDAGVNLFIADINVKGKSFKASNMENTGFQGKIDEMDFENQFFTVLMNATSYKIENDILYIYTADQKMELQLKKE